MDWSTLLAGAGVSAIVSALVSLVAVRTITIQQARASESERARREIRQIVQPLMRELSRYEYLARQEPKRTSEMSHMEDHGYVVKIRNAAVDLPWWRRALVERRCRRTFGHYWTSLADDYQSDDSVTAWVAGVLKRGEIPKGRGPLDGLLQRAYSQRADHPLLRKLRRELRRLAGCW